MMWQAAARRPLGCASQAIRSAKCHGNFFTVFHMQRGKEEGEKKPHAALRQGRRQTGPPSSGCACQGSIASDVSLCSPFGGLLGASNRRYLFIFVLLSASEALRLEGCEARVCIAGLVPLWLASRPAGCRRRLYWSRGLCGPCHHPGPLQGHVVVRGLPGRVARPFREIGDGDAHVAWRCGRWFPVPAFLSSNEPLWRSRRHSYVGRHGDRFGFLCGHRYHAAAFGLDGDILATPSLDGARITF